MSAPCRSPSRPWTASSRLFVISASGCSWRTRRHRRRKRLRQDGDRAVDPAACCRRDRRGWPARSCSRAAISPRCRRGRCARCAAARSRMIFQEPMSALDPVFTVGDQIAETLSRAFPGWQQAKRRSARSKRSPRSAFPRRPAVRRLSASALGRHAPAGDDRDRAGLRAEVADRRRADHRARRHRPGADHRSAAATSARAPARRCCSSPMISACRREPARAC